MHIVAVAKVLIKSDILVLSMGCGNAAMQVAGSGLKAISDTYGGFKP